MNRNGSGAKRVIIYSEVDWDFLDQRHHHLARHFLGRGHEVHFVERVVNRIPPLGELLARLWRGARGGAGEPAPRKPVPPGLALRRSPFLPHVYRIFRPLNYWLWWVFERRRQQDALLYSFVDNPVLFGGRLYRYRKSRLAAFDIIHNWWDFPWHSDFHRRAVAQTLELADRIICDSPAVCERYLPEALPVHLMLPGVAPEWFSDARERSSEDAIKPAPVFFGNLRGNSDLAFVEEVARTLGLTFFGILSGEAAQRIPSLENRGQLDAKQLPAAVAEYNIVVLPYNRDNFSATISPAKYFEALASGALLVTRAPLSHLPGFDRFCLLLGDEQGADLRAKIVERLKIHQRLREAQIEFAKTQSWVCRFEALEVFLGEG